MISLYIWVDTRNEISVVYLNPNIQRNHDSICVLVETHNGITIPSSLNKNTSWIMILFLSMPKYIIEFWFHCSPQDIRIMIPLQPNAENNTSTKRIWHCWMRFKIGKLVIEWGVMQKLQKVGCQLWDDKVRGEGKLKWCKEWMMGNFFTLHFFFEM